MEHLSFKTPHAEEVYIKNEDIQILVCGLELRTRTSILTPIKTLTEGLSLLGCDAVSSGDYNTLYLPAWLLFLYPPNDTITSLKSTICEKPRSCIWEVHSILHKYHAPVWPLNHRCLGPIPSVLTE